MSQLTCGLLYSLHGILPDDWKLRLLAPVQVGVYALDVTDTNGTHISINQKSLSVPSECSFQFSASSTISRTKAKIGSQVGNGSPNP